MHYLFEDKFKMNKIINDTNFWFCTGNMKKLFWFSSLDIFLRKMSEPFKINIIHVLLFA